MKKLLVLFILALILFPATHTEAANRALLIGIGKYQLKNANLPGIDKDIEMMRKVALSLGYERKDIKLLLDENATLANVTRAMEEWLIQGAGKDDHVLFYFSGHGTQIYDRNKDEPDKADEVLVLHDTTVGNNTLNNVLVDDAFNDMLSRMRSKNIFVLIDACHSGTATRSINKWGLKSKKLVYPGMPQFTRGSSFADKSIALSDSANYAALSAAQDNQRAQASNQGSFFTQGLEYTVAKASKGNHKLNMKQLHDETTQFISKKMPDPKLIHSPALIGGKTFEKRNIFVSKTPTKPSPNKKKATWTSRIMELQDNATFAMNIRTNGTVFRVGQPLQVNCTPNYDGYLNIITLQKGDKAPTILYPNQFHSENKVKAGQPISIPAIGDNFELPASKPAGKAIVAVFLTKEKINLYKESMGNTPFRQMTKASTRGFVVKKKKKKPTPQVKPDEPGPKPFEYGAGVIVLKIR